MICYLLYTDKINDTAVYLKEQIYEESDMPIVLFDSSFYYLDSNNAAKTVFNDKRLNLMKQKYMLIMHFVCQNIKIQILKLKEMEDFIKFIWKKNMKKRELKDIF